MRVFNRYKNSFAKKTYSHFIKSIIELCSSYEEDIDSIQIDKNRSHCVNLWFSHYDIQIYLSNRVILVCNRCYYTRRPRNTKACVTLMNDHNKTCV